jgi:hypothetical protein
MLTVAIVIALATAAFFIGRSFAPSSTSRAPSATTATGAHRQLYQCSMHPQIISDKPGKCPICQMNLEPVEEIPATTTTAAPEQRRILYYRNPMHPEITSPTPTKDEMGMDYVPVYEEQTTAGKVSEVPGHEAFTLSTERQQMIGVTRGKTEMRDLSMTIRTVGWVAYDPELYRAIVEYRQVLHQPGMETVTASAALRLRQLGLSEDMIKELAEPGHNPDRLLLPGKEVWVYAQVYEHELDLVHPGQPVEVTAPSLPGRTYTAKVVAVDPILNAATRSVRARILVETPEESLRPDMFVNVRLEIPLGKKLSLPVDAVLDTGEHQIVFLVKGAGTFEPRSVKLGRQADGYYEVLSGLEESEEVVTSANFLIDSESRFRSAVAAFKKTPPAAHQH